MKLCNSSEVSVDTAGLICRESRLAGVVRCVVWCGILALPVILGWRFNYPWVLWIGAIVFIIITPLMVMDVAAQFRATNWVLQISSNGMWINLQSYKDKVPEAVSVVWLDYQEIASAGRHTESYSTPSEMTGSTSKGRSGGDTIWQDVFLELQLNHEQTSELQAVLSNLRSRVPSSQSPSGQTQSRPRHFPVWLAGPAVLRIAWTSGHGHVVAPGIKHALTQLGTYVQLAEPTQRKRPNWRKLTAEEVDQLARELVHVQGADIEAVALLVRAGGHTHAEASRLVQQFEEQEGSVWAHEQGHSDLAGDGAG